MWHIGLVLAQCIGGACVRGWWGREGRGEERRGEECLEKEYGAG